MPLMYKRLSENKRISAENGDITMIEEMIINNKEKRERLVKRVEVLEKVKTLLLIPELEVMTTEQVADYYEVDYDAVKKVYQRNTDELVSDGMHIEKMETFLKGQNVSFQKERNKIILTYDNGITVSVTNRGLKVFPRRAILRVGMLLRDSVIAKEVRTQLLNIEEKTSDDIKISSINEEEKLLMNIALAYKSGEIDKLMTATSAYSNFQSRYIQELEPKAKIVDEMICNNSSVTTTITQRIKDTEATKKWRREIKNKELGKRTLRVLNFVHDFINENGFSPTVREIGDAVGLKSTSSVQAHMDKLDSLGYLVKDYKKTRNIRVNEDKYAMVIK